MKRTHQLRTLIIGYYSKDGDILKRFNTNCSSVTFELRNINSKRGSGLCYNQGVTTYHGKHEVVD